MKFISFKLDLSFLFLMIFLGMSFPTCDAAALLQISNPLELLNPNVQIPTEKIDKIGKVNITKINSYIEKTLKQGIERAKEFLEYRHEHVEKNSMLIEFFSPFFVILITFFIGFICFLFQKKGVLSENSDGSVKISEYKIIRYIVFCLTLNISAFGILRSFFVNNFVTNKLLESLFIIMILTIVIRFFTKLFLGIDLFIHKKLNFKEDIPQSKKGQVLVLHVGYFLIFSLISLVGCIPYIVTVLKIAMPFDVWGPIYAEITTILMDGLVGFYALSIILFIISNRKKDIVAPIKFYGLTLNPKFTYRLANLCAVLTFFLYMGEILRFVDGAIFDSFLSLTTISICLLLHKNWGGKASKYIQAFVETVFSKKFIQFFGKQNVQNYTQVAFNILNIGIVSIIILSFWNYEKVLEILSLIGLFIIEKCLIVGFIIFVTHKIQTFVNFSIKRIITQRTTVPIHLRDNSRLYALLLMASYFTPLLWIPVVVMVFLTFGVTSGFILSSFGILILVIGFGAKDLIEDIARGFFLIIDNTLDIGQNVTISDKGGTIEALTLRSVSWRSDDGILHSMPYSKLTLVSNNTSEFAYAMLEIGVAYNSDLIKTMQVMTKVGQDLMDDPKFKKSILSPIEIMGVDKFTDFSISIKARLKVLPMEQWKVRRELNLRIKQRFDLEGIVMPFPQMDIRVFNDKN